LQRAGNEGPSSVRIGVPSGITVHTFFIQHTWWHGSVTSGTWQWDFIEE
jgi:hypothetical protein